MTTENEAREAVYKRFVDNWGGASPYVFENEKFQADPAADWVRLSFRNTNSNQGTLGATGNKRYERDASIFLQIFTLVNTGTKNIDTLVRTFRSIFEGTRFSGVAVNNVVSREGKEDGKFKQTTVEAFSQYFETK